VLDLNKKKIKQIINKDLIFHLSNTSTSAIKKYFPGPFNEIADNYKNAILFSEDFKKK
jgi:hypothetical protein